ncbi:hypothetical protein HRI_002758800 [Hibiscus trionum]|uniref:Endonuclease/exonuclease/phosphatase domain-containing protein n=1 Tax=Hibiscus trionum TaxID=183268 RepID=A0A9W7IAW2_HIBTR|nr:hypothetical protein HRI_002758800 [Hibiscus trionum]
MSLNLFVWNVQGCGSRNFVRVTKQYIRDYRPDVCVFVEPRVSGRRASQIISSLGIPNSYRIEACGFSGGIWLCWFDHIQISILSCHFQFIHCSISSVNSQESFLATFVYASPNCSLRKDLWRHLSNMAQTILRPWVVLGDFNATLSPSERQGCSSIVPDSQFQDMVFYCGLQDLGFAGPNFTWYRGNRSVRLDRCFGNAAWYEHFPQSSLHHLLRMKSDHRPIMLYPAVPPTSPRQPSFKYFSGWSLHSDFKRLVHDNWDSTLPISEAISSFTGAAVSWNNEIFGAIGKRKKILMARLRGVQRCLDQRRSANMVKLESKLL